MQYGRGKWPTPLQSVIEVFAEIDDQMEKLEVLFDFAEEIDELPTSQWNDSTVVLGCQSEAHVMTEYSSEKGFHLLGAADAKLVQGLMAITAIALEGLSIEEVIHFPVEFTAEMGLMNILTPSRANGFRNMFKKIQDEARAMEE